MTVSENQLPGQLRPEDVVACDLFPPPLFGPSGAMWRRLAPIAKMRLRTMLPSTGGQSADGEPVVDGRQWLRVLFSRSFGQSSGDADEFEVGVEELFEYKADATTAAAGLSVLGYVRVDAETWLAFVAGRVGYPQIAYVFEATTYAATSFPLDPSGEEDAIEEGDQLQWRLLEIVQLRGNLTALSDMRQKCASSIEEAQHRFVRRQSNSAIDSDDEEDDTDAMSSRWRQDSHKTETESNASDSYWDNFAQHAATASATSHTPRSPHNNNSDTDYFASYDKAMARDEGHSDTSGLESTVYIVAGVQDMWLHAQKAGMSAEMFRSAVSAGVQRALGSTDLDHHPDPSQASWTRQS